MTTFTLRKGSPAKTSSDLVVIGVVRSTKGEPVAAAGGEDVAAAYGRAFKPMLDAMGFSGEAGETLRVPTSKKIKAGQLLLVGLGAADAVTSEKVRRAAGVASRSLGNAASVSVALPMGDAAHVRAVAEGFLSGLYRFTAYKSKQSDSKVAEVAFLSDIARRDEATRALEEARVVSDLVAAARDWVNLPPNDLTPAKFATAVEELHRERGGRRSRVKVDVLGVEELTALGCGGVLGVGQGSANPPRMVKLTYRPRGATASLALVGKGITFDSGGLTIKPGNSMATMKCDMGGAAAVLAATFAIAALELPVNVTTYAPMAENMPSGTAMRPGDVLTMYGGRTVEVTNTDAEGRLLLADAIAMAVEEEPDVILDVATLTGACMVALGDRIAGVMGEDGPVSDVQAAAEASGELFWPLPIPEQSRKAVVDTKIADVLQSNWVRWGGALYAAAFLREFTEGRPWAHLDIAGPAFNTGGPWGHVPSGGTGFGVSTLVEYAARLAGGDRG